MTKSDNKIKGKQGEELAVLYLKDRGLKIVETNWRFSRFGEIDIIAEDKNTLAFIEVKARTSTAFGHPLEAINYSKMNKIKEIAGAYLSQNSDKKYSGYRFDAVSVILAKEPKIEYIKDIYQF